MEQVSTVELAVPFMFAGQSRKTIVRRDALKLEVDFARKVITARPRNGRVVDFIIPFDNVVNIVLANEAEIAEEIAALGEKTQREIEAAALALADKIDAERRAQTAADIASQLAAGVPEEDVRPSDDADSDYVELKPGTLSSLK